MLKGWLALTLGTGMILVAAQGLVTGALPAGRNGWGRSQGRVRRADQPLLFWAMFAMDVTIGIVAVRYGGRLI